MAALSLKDAGKRVGRNSRFKCPFRVEWISLQVADLKDNQSRAVHILVPKKIVRLAVARNRLKRLIREAVRADDFFQAPKIFFVRIIKKPETLNLSLVKQMLNNLH